MRRFEEPDQRTEGHHPDDVPVEVPYAGVAQADRVHTGGRAQVPER